MALDIRRGMGHIFGSFELIVGEWLGGGGEGGIFCMKSPLYREIAYSGIPDCQGKSKVRRDAEQSRFSSSRGGDKRFSSRDSDKRFSLRDSDKRFFSRDSVKRFSSRDVDKRFSARDSV